MTVHVSVLDVRDLSVFAGSTDTEILRGVTFSCRPGAATFIVGPSGCGKTQLLRQIAGLNPLKQKDSLLLAGKTPKAVGIPNWRQQVLYVSQNKPTVKSTPRQFLDLVLGFTAQPKADRAALDRAAVELGMDAALMDQDWSALSGGQSQRAMLAVALTLRPRVLLLDEPTAHLDPGTTQLVEQVLIDTLSRNRMAALWVSHNPAQVERLANEVVDVSTFRVPVGV